MMVDNVSNDLLLEHMKAVRAELAAMRNDIRELRDRQNETHSAVLAVRRDRNITLDAHNIEKLFRDYCAKVGRCD